MGLPIHVLSNINRETRRAVCAHCGPVSVRRHYNSWRCNKGNPGSNVYNIRKYGQRRKPGSVPDKRPHRKMVGTVCERCGFVPEDIIQLDIHHKDGNGKNNDPANLQTLCANCHRMVHHIMRKIRRRILTLPKSIAG